MRRIKLREGQHFSLAPHLKLMVVGVSDDQVELELVDEAQQQQPGLPRNARVGRDAPSSRDSRAHDESESRFYVEFA
ncbi:MAG: hypothetical protein AB7U73_01595 [Pirellulales bacterium]